jgi:uncharacterized LabA/DUF88 family protein
MKKTALLIDGGWFCRALANRLKLPGKWPTAHQVIKNAKSVLGRGEDLFRIFYYDCEPYSLEVTNPVDGSKINYSTLPTYAARLKFFHDLGQSSHVALRRGELKPRGWTFSRAYRQSLMAGGVPLAPRGRDVYANFEQKGVDMRIGIDVATLALKGIVDRIVLFSGDTDMVPALKLARREGLQVFLVRVQKWPLKHTLIEDSDGVRELVPTS